LSGWQSKGMDRLQRAVPSVVCLTVTGNAQVLVELMLHKHHTDWFIVAVAH